MGGDARAKALTKAQRSEIARRAADARWERNLPVATHDGEIELAGGVKIACAVLGDGTRVLSQRGLAAAFGATTKPSSGAQDGGGRLPALMRASNLKPFISKELMAGAETSPPGFHVEPRKLPTFGSPRRFTFRRIRCDAIPSSPGRPSARAW